MVRISVWVCMIVLLVCVLPMVAQQPASTGDANESAASATPDAQVGASVSGSGTTSFIPIWTNSTTLGNSVLFQLGTGAKAKVGIGTTKPASALDVKGGATIRGLFSLPTTGTATATAGFNSQPMDLAASVFNSSAGLAIPQTFQWRAEPVGNDTGTATGSLNLLFAQGTGKPAETGLNIASNGQLTFATGQTFPGTVGSVTAGTDLTNTGTDTNPILNLDTTKVPQLGTANTFTGNQTVNGNLLVSGGVISVGGSRVLSCTRACGQIGVIGTGQASLYSTGAVATPAGYSLTGCSAYWAINNATCGNIAYPSGSYITALDDGAGACHALGYNGSGGTLASCACVTACQLP